MLSGHIRNVFALNTINPHGYENENGFDWRQSITCRLTFSLQLYSQCRWKDSEETHFMCSNRGSTTGNLCCAMRRKIEEQNLFQSSPHQWWMMEQRLDSWLNIIPRVCGWKRILPVYVRITTCLSWAMLCSIFFSILYLMWWRLYIVNCIVY